MKIPPFETLKEIAVETTLEWMEISESVERSNREIANRLIGQIYTQSGLNVPEIVWSASPLENSVAAISKENKGFLITKTLTQTWCLNKVKRRYQECGRGDEYKEIHDTVVGSIEHHSWHPLCKWTNFTYDGNVWRLIRHSVGSINKSRRGALIDIFNQSGFAETIALEKPSVDLMRYAGQFIMFDNHCFVCEKPTAIKYVWDHEEYPDLPVDQYLHCDDGPAICWADDFQVFAKYGSPDFPDPIIKFKLENGVFVPR